VASRIRGTYRDRHHGKGADGHMNSFGIVAPAYSRSAKRGRMAILALAVAGLVALIVAQPTAVGAVEDVALRLLRFSPDGRYVLAQDDSEIAVLSVHPLAVLFRIPAELAGDAQFTPDSREVIFVGSLSRADPRFGAGPERALLVRSALHVERWSVADRSQADSTTVKGTFCPSEQVSPDGHTLACNDAQGTLTIQDVASGATLLEKRQFVRPIPLYSYFRDGSIDAPNGKFLGDPGMACLDFSPDGRYLLAVAGAEHRTLGFDLDERRVERLGGSIGRAAHCSSVFIAPHRLVVVPSYPQGDRMRARLMDFPSTREIAKATIPVGPLRRATDPGFILIRPFGKRSLLGDPRAWRAAAAELATGEVIISGTAAMDVLGPFYVAESSPGTVGLYERGKGLQAIVALHER